MKDFFALTLSIFVCLLCLSGCYYGMDACFDGLHIRDNLEDAPLTVLRTKVGTKNGKRILAVRLVNNSHKVIDAWRACYVFYDHFDEVIRWPDENVVVAVAPAPPPNSSIPPYAIRRPTRTERCYSGNARLEPGERHTAFLKVGRGSGRIKSFEACIYAIHYEKGSTWER